MRLETNTIQAGWDPKNGEPRVAPIVQSTTYAYDTAQNVADLFDLKAAGHMYSRISNPTCEVLEQKIALLEGGVAALATSAGQMASTIAIANLCSSGDHFIAAGSLYGGTVALFSNTFKKMGIEVSYVDAEAPLHVLKQAIRPNTKAIFAETIANPALDVLDFEKFAALAKEAGVPFVVDNTFATPFLCRPFEHGANIVTHSATKYLDGHAVAVGGLIVDKGDFDWTNGKFPQMTEPDPSYHGVVYTKNFGNLGYIVKARVQWIRDLGAYLSPMNAFLINLGMETLHVRMQRHCENAQALAEFLQNHPKVAWVNYPGLPSHKHHERLKCYCTGASGVLTFGVKGGQQEGEKVMNALKLARILVHVADLRTCVLHPASMTHRQLDEAALKAAGVSPDLIRVSVGLEHIEDIKADFEHALSQL
ncbi:MAG: PLP-dependent transferase [Campylobacterales bacterium]|nr:PLP-dependent transferase [Campylobacterales bacterium]